ncbi:multiple sugar transport system permease protein [Crossiella equi]|uniref:Multiple sugar transport system permease protein n=1 Tax=Crossiella equi TaxID=130796 RepID=A0ABS5ATQ3_9PSEU|nr:sugar ABC transporter permease [Crossiella equi]MBP2479065.1 multiple sugar transport system permease protein [Crossiella equi]
MSARTPLGRHRWYVPLLFVGPVLLVQGTFLFTPLVNTFVLAFTNASTVGGGHFTGLDNFARLAGDEEFWAAVGRTFLYLAITAPVIVLLSTSLAILVNTRLRGSGVVRALLFSPMVMPLATVAVLFQFVLRSDGLANQLLTGLHLIAAPLPFLTSSDLALLSLTLVTVWRGCALATLITLAALQNVSEDLDEAARIDGAGWLRRTWSVTLPQIRGTTVLVGVLAAISALRVFTEPYVLTGGGPGDATETIVLYLFERGVSPGTQAGYASAISLVLFVFVLAAAAVTGVLAKRRRA